MIRDGSLIKIEDSTGETRHGVVVDVSPEGVHIQICFHGEPAMKTLWEQGIRSVKPAPVDSVTAG